MRRVLVVLAAMLALSACGDRQMRYYWDAVTGGHADEANTALEEYKATKAEATAGRPCAQWYDLAIQAGFTPEQWKEPISRIMFRESHCDPGADNPSSTARGLMQELRMWADDCGGVYTDLYDPTFNIDCAFHIWQVSGWGAWSTY